MLGLGGYSTAWGGTWGRKHELRRHERSIAHQLLGAASLAERDESQSQGAEDVTRGDVGHREQGLSLSGEVGDKRQSILTATDTGKTQSPGVTNTQGIFNRGCWPESVPVLLSGSPSPGDAFNSWHPPSPLHPAWTRRP